MNRNIFLHNIKIFYLGFSNNAKSFLERLWIQLNIVFISFSYNCFDSQFVLEGSYLVNKPIYANYPIIDWLLITICRNGSGWWFWMQFMASGKRLNSTHLRWFNTIKKTRIPTNHTQLTIFLKKYKLRMILH